MPNVIIDTNVPVVANGLAQHAGRACEDACIDRLLLARARDVIVLDASGLILEEYRRFLSHQGQPGAGDAFFKWLWDNQANPKHCRRIEITPIDPDARLFEEFPTDARLQSFDAADRKFVAVAVASGEDSSILNASDTDWWQHRKALQENGIHVHFVCPELMTRRR